MALSQPETPPNSAAPSTDSEQLGSRAEEMLSQEWATFTSALTEEQRRLMNKERWTEIKGAFTEEQRRCIERLGQQQEQLIQEKLEQECINRLRRSEAQELYPTPGASACHVEKGAMQEDVAIIAHGSSATPEESVSPSEENTKALWAEHSSLDGSEAEEEDGRLHAEAGGRSPGARGRRGLGRRGRGRGERAYAAAARMTTTACAARGRGATAYDAAAGTTTTACAEDLTLVRQEAFEALYGGDAQINIIGMNEYRKLLANKVPMISSVQVTGFRVKNYNKRYSGIDRLIAVPVKLHGEIFSVTFLLNRKAPSSAAAMVGTLPKPLRQEMLDALLEMEGFVEEDGVAVEATPRPFPSVRPKPRLNKVTPGAFGAFQPRNGHSWCVYCKIPGHDINTCRKKKASDEFLARHAPQPLPPQPFEATVDMGAFCIFCNQVGHSIVRCSAMREAREAKWTKEREGDAATDVAQLQHPLVAEDAAATATVAAIQPALKGALRTKPVDMSAAKKEAKRQRSAAAAVAASVAEQTPRPGNAAFVKNLAPRFATSMHPPGTPTVCFAPKPLPRSAR